MPKVYSPSQTMEWLSCPMKRALRREGWIGKGVAKVDYAAALGSAFAAGVGVYNSLRQAAEGSDSPLPPLGDLGARKGLVEASTKVAVATLEQRLSSWDELGLIDSGDPDGYREKIVIRAIKAITSYIINDPLPAKYRIVGVELDLGESAGNARPDLVVEDALGLHVVDYKSKLTLKADYRAKTLQEYANSHQMLHYGHFVGEHFNRPVAGYAIGLAVLEPRWLFDLVPYPYHPETLAIWYQSAKVIWESMEREDRGEVPPFLAAKHSDNFGQCPYYKACFVHRYDEQLMLQDYKLVERATNA